VVCISSSATQVHVDHEGGTLTGTSTYWVQVQGAHIDALLSLLLVLNRPAGKRARCGSRAGVGTVLKEHILHDRIVNDNGAAGMHFLTLCFQQKPLAQANGVSNS
jgi:hypothetical protein